MLKRSVDIAISAALLLLASPVLLLAAVLILLSSPGPVLFRQTRVGRNFQAFEILKLRTMVHAEAGLPFTLGPDPRITPVGWLLRRTKVDELPQLWNVLRGQMSLVGPRPVVPQLIWEFQDEYAFLLRVRPGLTDPASLKYSQEARLLERARDPMGFFKSVVTPDKIRISFEYMSEADLWSDLATMVMTAVICCFPAASRLFGELPEVMDAHIPELWPPKRVERKAVIASDGSIFAHQLAQIEAQFEAQMEAQVESQIEAETEQIVPADVLPWIRLPNPHYAPQSAPAGSGRSANRL